MGMIWTERSLIGPHNKLFKLANYFLNIFSGTITNSAWFLVNH